jgi:hypothetical protein
MQERLVADRGGAHVGGDAQRACNRAAIAA